MKEQLLFVYNANSDLFSSVADFAHKILSPSTYLCQLCALTYGNFSIKQQWKSFIENLGMSAAFLHKDEFQKQYPLQPALPAVFIEINGKIQEIISSKEINACRTLEDLKFLITEKIQQHVQHHHSNI